MNELHHHRRQRDHAHVLAELRRLHAERVRACVEAFTAANWKGARRD